MFRSLVHYMDCYVLSSHFIVLYMHHVISYVHCSRWQCEHVNEIAMKAYRAFSHDVMLSSNMAASIAMAINIHLCKHLFTLLCVTVSPWTSPFLVQVHDDHVRTWCAWLPWISRSVRAIRRSCWRTAWRQWKRSLVVHNVSERSKTS